MSGYGCQLIATALLRPTEMVSAAHVAGLVMDMRRDGVQLRPVRVERAPLAIRDGHHRFRAAEALGLERINAVLIAYDDPRLTLSSWSEAVFTRDEVLAAAASGRLLPAKSTRHMLNPPLGDAPVPLSALGATVTSA